MDLLKGQVPWRTKLEQVYANQIVNEGFRTGDLKQRHLQQDELQFTLEHNSPAMARPPSHETGSGRLVNENSRPQPT